MKEIKLLDCTLRDGGYVNDWNFGHDNIITIFERLISAGVDVLEIGFLDDRRPYDRNRTPSAIRSKNWGIRFSSRPSPLPAIPTGNFWIWWIWSTS